MTKELSVDLASVPDGQNLFAVAKATKKYDGSPANPQPWEPSLPNPAS